MEKFVLSPKECAAYIGIGECDIRLLCQRGEIKATRSGHNWKIPRPCAEDYIMQKALKGEPIVIDRKIRKEV